MPSASIGDIHIGQNGAWKVPGARWPAIVLAIVLLDVVCFYAFSLFAMDTTHFVWMSAKRRGVGVRARDLEGASESLEKRRDLEGAAIRKAARAGAAEPRRTPTQGTGGRTSAPSGAT